MKNEKWKKLNYSLSHTTYHLPPNTNYAFSLLELIIVIVIIGVVYYLTSFTFKKYENTTTIHNLQKLVPSSNKKIQFVCFDECRKCMFLQDNKIVKKDISLQLNKCHFYKLDKYNEPITVKTKIITIDEQDYEVNFTINFYPNKSNDIGILENDKKFYTVNSFFNFIKEASTLNKAKELLTKTNLLTD
jgi:prepilin-type N-terminal cleavage/methylation domain-containing protein